MTTRSDDPVTHTANSTQTRMIEATAADVEQVQDIRDMYQDAGWTERGYDVSIWHHHDGLKWLHSVDSWTVRSGPVKSGSEKEEQIRAGARSRRHWRPADRGGADSSRPSGAVARRRSHERAAEAEAWLAVAQQDHKAAVAGIGYRDLAAMGPESVITEPAPCGYPEADREAGS